MLFHFLQTGHCKRKMKLQKKKLVSIGNKVNGLIKEGESDIQEEDKEVEKEKTLNRKR